MYARDDGDAELSAHALCCATNVKSLIIRTHFAFERLDFSSDNYFYRCCFEPHFRGHKKNPGGYYYETRNILFLAKRIILLLAFKGYIGDKFIKLLFYPQSRIIENSVDHGGREGKRCVTKMRKKSGHGIFFYRSIPAKLYP